MNEHKVLHQQSAIVTGAGSGIGLSIAKVLSSNGASVILNDIDPELANEAAAEIRASGGKCLAIAGDAGDVSFVDSMVQSAVKEYGKLNIAIANAGITTYGTFLKYSKKNFDKLIHLNLQGSFFLAQASAKQMIKQNSGGKIIFMSSVTGHQAHPYLVPYGMTKAALQMLAKGLVCELSKYKININTISPGAVLNRRTLAEDPNYGDEWAKLTPTNDITLPEDVAQAVLFLVSPNANQITGQTLLVDGGWTSTSQTPELTFPEE